jgi:hypothetical protein
MRFDRTMAVLVLGAGVMFGGIAAAETEEPKYPPKTMTEIGTNPWTQVALKPEHAILAGLAGKFTTKVHLYSGPFPRMLDTEGTAEAKLIMGGAFVQLTHSEKRMKQSFEAMTTYAFDEATRKFTASSIDSASSAIVNLVGTYDAEKKQIVMTGRFSDPRVGFLTIVKTVTTFVDANTWTYDEFVSHKVGDPETKVVTITFKRS